MKKNTGLLLLLIGLIVIAAIFLFNRKSGTIGEELRDFTVKDTGAVTKLFLADKKGSQVLLERQPDGTWSLNGNE